MSLIPPTLRDSSKDKKISLSRGGCRGCARSGSERFVGNKASIKIDVAIDHAIGGETLAGAGEGAVGVGLAHRTVGIELAQHSGQAVGVVRAEVDCGIAPDFAEAGYVIGDDGAAGESGVERGHAQRLVARGGNVDGGAAVERTELGFGLRAADGDVGVRDGDLYVGADRNARNRNGLFRTHDTHGKRMTVLSQEKD